MPCNRFKSDRKGYKICSWCGIEKPATLEYFKSCKGALYNVASRCKECDKEYRKNTKEHTQEYCKVYYIKNRDSIVVNSQTHRAKRYNVEADFTLEEWKDCLRHFNYKCAYCGRESNELAQEHFIAITKGGHYNKYNIVPACSECNKNKMTRDFLEWFPKQDFYSKEKGYKILSYLELI